MWATPENCQSKYCNTALKIQFFLHKILSFLNSIFPHVVLAWKEIIGAPGERSRIPGPKRNKGSRAMASATIQTDGAGQVSRSPKLSRGAFPYSDYWLTGRAIFYEVMIWRNERRTP
jgi:hypothetical protein